MTCNKCNDGKYDVGINKIEVIVAIPPVEVYLKIKDERITDEIKINVEETKQIKVIYFCFVITSYYKVASSNTSCRLFKIAYEGDF